MRKLDIKQLPYTRILIQLAIVTIYSLCVGKEMAIDYINNKETILMFINLCLILPVNVLIAMISGYKSKKHILILSLLGIILTLLFEVYVGSMVIRLHQL